jgi:hypothetical protein
LHQEHEGALKTSSNKAKEEKMRGGKKIFGTFARAYSEQRKTLWSNSRKQAKNRKTLRNVTGTRESVMSRTPKFQRIFGSFDGTMVSFASACSSCADRGFKLWRTAALALLVFDFNARD